jgi:undecaprenyl diphosphate synthase
MIPQSQLNELKKSLIPHHVAIIPDGNRRWAMNQNTDNVVQGHLAGVEKVMDIVEAAADIGIKVLTFYTFSTENWQRPKLEVDALMDILESYLVDQRPRMLASGVRLNTIGDIKGLPQRVQEKLKETLEATSHCSRIDLILALNYGSRDEIKRAVGLILDDYSLQRLKREDLTEKLIGNYLDTAKWPDPDLFIRASGEQRISNFLLWQLSYTELYMPHVLWPDFTPHHLFEAIVHYQKRQRRFGGDIK